MIEVKNIVKTYGQTNVVDDISFKVEKGEILGFLGPNGAGKTTTMNMITGYINQTSGTIIVDSFDISKDKNKVKGKIGYMPEILPLYLDMTVNEYLKFVCELKKLDKKIIKEEINNVCEKVGLVEVRKMLIRNLSRGYKQRVGIAQAIIGNPEVIILDEPTVGLDPNQIQEIRTLIRSLAAEHTVILSTHILSEVKKLCSKVIIINRGKIVGAETVEKLELLMSKGKVIKITVEGKEKIEDVLKGVSGVLSVDNVDNSSSRISCEVTLDIKNEEDNKEIVKNISKTLVKEKYIILELTDRVTNLEDIFANLTK